MRIMRRLLFATLLLGATGIAGLAPIQAKADGGFFFGVGSGGHFGHHHGHYHHRSWYGPRGYGAWGYGYRPYRRYQPPPTVVYVLPPAQPAPQVLVQAAPQPRVVQPAPVFAYDTSYCREYSRTAVVNGAPVEIYGTACRQPDGAWRIVN